MPAIDLDSDRLWSPGSDSDCVGPSEDGGGEHVLGPHTSDESFSSIPPNQLQFQAELQEGAAKRRRLEVQRHADRVRSTETPSPQRAPAAPSRGGSHRQYAEQHEASTRKKARGRSSSPAFFNPQEAPAKSPPAKTAEREAGRSHEMHSHGSSDPLGSVVARRRHRKPPAATDVSRRATSVPLPPKQSSKSARHRSTSAPASAGLKICTICDDVIQPGDEYKWYNEHKICGNTQRMAERQLRKPQHQD